MKKIFSLFLFVISLSSCTSQSLPKNESSKKESILETASAIEKYIRRNKFFRKIYF